MQASSSSSASAIVHPLDMPENKQTIQDFNQTLEKVKKMKPVDVWAISWNLPDMENTLYKTEEEAKRNYYDENHSEIRKFTDIVDCTGAFYIVKLNLKVKLEPIDVHDRKSQLEEKLNDTRKRKREIKEELAEFSAV